jgi:Ca2+-binding RTX toxin-like protein
MTDTLLRNRGPRTRAFGLALLLVGTATSASVATPARAATIERVGSALVFTAGTGEANRLAISLEGSGNGIRVTDSGVGPADNQTADGHPIISSKSPTDCAAAPVANQALCDAGAIQTIRVVLGDGDDSVAFSGLKLRTVIDGGPGADQISGMELSDALTGGAGADSIGGGGGDDIIQGGDGDDVVLRGGSGNDQIDGGSGNDELQGEDGNDTLNAGSGKDKIDAGAGDDSLTGGSGGDVLQGGVGTDTVSYADRTAPLNLDVNHNPDDGEAGENDDINNDVEVVIGGSGDDRIAGRDDTDPPAGSSGANDVLVGGPGDDTILGRGGNDAVQGGDGKDLLDGGSGADSIAGGAGDDTITYGSRATGVSISLDGTANDGGSGESDNIAGDIESIFGGAGDDVITGNDERNMIGGQGGNDTIRGGGGDDVINGGEGADSVSGGDGKDIVNYTWEAQPISASYDGVANDGADGEGDNLGTDIEGVLASPAGDRLLGGPSNDFLYGYSGDDILLGGPGSDTIVGGEGNDFIQSMDGRPDFVSCGEPPDGEDPASDADVALVDARDSVAADCETKVVGTAVSVTTPAAGLQPTGGALLLPLACQRLILDECAGIVSLTTRITVQPKPTKPVSGTKPGKGQKKGKQAKPAKPQRRVLTLGVAPFQLAPDGTTRVTIALSKLGLALLAKAGKLTVTAKATNMDAAGSQSVTTQSFVLRRPAPPRPASPRKP